jgi:hypothetical protein
LEELPAAPASDHGVVLALAWSDGLCVEVWFGFVEPFVCEETAALLEGSLAWCDCG